MVRRAKRANLSRRGDGTVLPRQVLIWGIAGAVVLILFLGFGRMLFRGVQNFFHPYFAVAETGIRAASAPTMLLHSRNELAAALSKLQQENRVLKLQSIENLQLREENQMLRKLLQMEAPEHFTYIATGILNRDPIFWSESFTVDRGSSDGVESGLAVIGFSRFGGTEPVLLGVVDQVAEHSARVITVLNASLRLSVRLTESDCVGFLNSGRSADAAALQDHFSAIGYLPGGGILVLNEEVRTSGYEKRIPGGVLIGTLGVIDQEPTPYAQRLYRTGAIRSAGDFDHLSEVLIARPMTGTTESAK